MTQPAGATAYDVVTYPSGVFTTTHADHLATIARLHGLSPPPVATARVLEIGGGDGMNTIAMAAAYPDARFLSIDLAAIPVARGRTIAAAAGCGNVRIEVANILDAARDLDGPFDYVAAHGVYAWVPPAVQEALLALIGRVLAPDGVAFLSYNALPGGHLRRAIREMALHHVADIADAEERLTVARAYIAAFGQPQADDRPLLTAMRDVARPIAAKPRAALHHDELGETFAPQSFTQVVAAARAHGLRFLNEAEPGRLDDGLPNESLDEPAVLRRVQAGDDANMCFFHQTLLVRDTQVPQRRPAIAAIRELYASAHCERVGDTDFRSADGTFGISDAPLAEAVARIAQAWPERVRVRDVIDDELRLEALWRLYLGKAILLHSTPLPGTRTPGSHPRASGLVRALLGMGEQTVYTLDHRVLRFEEPEPRAFIALLDGTRDRTALAAAWAASGFAHETGVDAALASIAAMTLMVA